MYVKSDLNSTKYYWKTVTSWKLYKDLLNSTLCEFIKTRSDLKSTLIVSLLN